jgi:hypothetical protein
LEGFALARAGLGKVDSTRNLNPEHRKFAVAFSKPYNEAQIDKTTKKPSTAASRDSEAYTDQVAVQDLRAVDALPSLEGSAVPVEATGERRHLTAMLSDLGGFDQHFRADQEHDRRMKGSH